jgi:hypothetical protein
MLITGLKSLFSRIFGTRKSVVRTRELILEDAQGNVRTQMLVDENNNTVMYFRDAQGENRLMMGLTADGTPRITMWYANGVGKIELEANDRVNTAGMAVVGESGQVQVLMGVARNGLPAVALFDKNGQALFPHALASKHGQAMDPAPPEEEGFDWDSILRP